MKKPRAQNEAKPEAEAEADKVAEAEEDARQLVLAQNRKLKAKLKQNQNDGPSSGHKNGWGCHHVSRQLHSKQTTFNDQNEAFLTLLMSIDGALATLQQHV